LEENQRIEARNATASDVTIIIESNFLLLTPISPIKTTSATNESTYGAIRYRSEIPAKTYVAM
jgi:hypothetical protein